MSYLGTNKVGKMYLGSTAIGKAYLGENLVYDSAGGGVTPVLPYDAEIEYLQSTGEQWIDTGITPSETLSFECTFQNNNTSNSPTGYGNVFGSRMSSRTNEYQLSNYTNLTISIGYRNENNGATTAVRTITFDGDTTATIDGVSKTITKGTVGTGGGTVVLFGIRQNGSVTQLQAGKIYHVKFGNLIDLIPVRIGQVGYMYDRISGQLFENKGNGNFTLGNDITT